MRLPTATAGYHKDFVTALVATGRGLAIVIPPSIGFIIYGAITGTSISKLFIAGIIPGLIVDCALIAMIFFVSWKRGYGGEPFGRIKEIRRALREAIWALLAPVIILGGIYWGLFTPTEAGAVAVIYGLVVVGGIYRNLNLSLLGQILLGSSVSTAVVILLLVFAGVFGWANVTLGIIETVSKFLIGCTSNVFLLLFLITCGLLLAGMVMDPGTLYFITLPILMPVVIKF